MTSTAILWPMIAQVLLVYCVYALLSLRRRQAVRGGHARVSQFRENREEPPESLFVRNNLANQFELPVLFYVACLALFVTGAGDAVSVTLAWLFVASRVMHAVVHVTTNRIRHRQPLFIAGFVLLALLWLWLALSIASLA